MPKKILMIDDEPDIVKMIHVRMAAEGYELISAESGLEGLDKAQKEKPDLILLDVMMPKMDGLETLRRLRYNKGTTSIPVVMLTARDDEESVMEAKELGAKDYIIKPFNAETLLETVKRNLPF